jgi:hypothetical protein
MVKIGNYNTRGGIMKKLLVILSCMFLMVGCSLDNTPTKKTEELFKKYQTLDDGVLSDLELTAEGAELTSDKQKESYMKAMKMQYSDLKYEITDEEINGDEATVTVKISVYDFYKVQKDANDYLKDNPDEFMNDDVHDAAKFMEYKLKHMNDASDRIDYTIKVDLTKEDDEWVVESFDKETLEKIHGTYNYERE